MFIKQCNKLNDILPGLFEKTEDYMELLLNISFTSEDGVVRQLIENISEEDFTNQVEIIGWLYQYYNSELKDETFANLKKRVKIGKERIPAATQLFTPDWIVKYMVENSVGRLWLESHPNEELKAKWKVSISAMIKRCETLNIFSYSQIKYLKDQMTRKGYWRHEPLDSEMPIERPFAHKQALSLLFEHNIISPYKFVSDIGCLPEELEEYCCLDKGMLKSSEPVQMVKLRRIK